MNLVLEDAEEVNVKKKTRKTLGKSERRYCLIIANILCHYFLIYICLWFCRKDSSERRQYYSHAEHVRKISFIITSAYLLDQLLFPPDPVNWVFSYALEWISLQRQMISGRWRVAMGFGLCSPLSLICVVPKTLVSFTILSERYLWKLWMMENSYDLLSCVEVVCNFCETADFEVIAWVVFPDRFLLLTESQLSFRQSFTTVGSACLALFFFLKIMFVYKEQICL